MRLDGVDDSLHTGHHRSKVDRAGNAAQTQRFCFAQLFGDFGRANQRLARHATEVQAIAAHLVAFDQRDFGLDSGSDVRRDQPAGSGTDDDQVAVEVRRLLPARVDLAPLQRRDDGLGDEREHPQQHEAAEQRGREHVRQLADRGELRAGVDEHHGAGEHAELTDPVKTAGADGRQTSEQVDHEEREQGHQAQRQQVKNAIARHALVDRAELFAKARLHRITQQVARDQKGQQCAQTGRERHDDQPHAEPEHRTGSERQDCRSRERERGGRHVDAEKSSDGEQRSLGIERGERVTAGLERIEGQQATEIEVAVQQHRHHGQHAGGDPEAAFGRGGHCDNDAAAVTRSASSAPPQLLP